MQSILEELFILIKLMGKLLLIFLNFKRILPIMILEEQLIVLN